MEREDKIFEVSYQGKDTKGFIIKGIKVVAESEEDALVKVKEVSSSYEIYSATEIKPSDK